ncbi:MAG: SPFH domain-containing protein [bacterium]|nr:SPFH domain-containing protein [bacterium]
MADPIRERDLVLGPNEFAMILDETKGHVTVYVGPHKTSLSNTDRPVVADERGKFKSCTLDEAIKVFPTADEGSYIVLKNPAKDEARPKAGSNTNPELKIGRKINTPGPVSFPLWPGQYATVIEGHRLRSNQYLVVRVYNNEEAKKPGKIGVMEPSVTGEGPKDKKEINPPNVDLSQDLTMGQLLVITGTDVSFYIPPTGIEVIPDGNKYVRDAVTLERLEYCILLEENGNKRFVQGPAVVFPEPTETFVQNNSVFKFKAIELNENMGLYIKVIADYKDETGKEHKTGEELFITGKEQKIYFPRQEHAIIKYAEDEGKGNGVQFAIAIPAGEARYVLDKMTGKIDLKKGPLMFLADPRNEVIVRRVLDPNTVKLLFPGNTAALDYNTTLASLIKDGAQNYISEQEASGKRAKSIGPVSREASLVSENFERRSTFTPPRTITLDTKYEGAVALNVWTGYAVQIVGKTGKRRVVKGPQTVLLEYDESLEVLTMSTGTPKNDDKVIKTVYLLSQNNKVSDEVTAETKDLVTVNVRVSYRVNFEGEPENWFNVDNYVKLLTEHLRSMIRNAIKQNGIEDFNDKGVGIIRDTVLGLQNEEGKRPGRAFAENGMKVYDVEVLDVKIGDQEIGELLRDAQRESVEQSLTLRREEQKLKKDKRLETIAQETAEAMSETVIKKLDIKKKEDDKILEVNLKALGNQQKKTKAQHNNDLAIENGANKVSGIKLSREKKEADQKQEISKATQDLQVELMQARTKAITDELNAAGPQLLAIATTLADKELAGKLAQVLSPLAIYGNKTLPDVVQQLTQGTVLESIVKKIIDAGSTAKTATAK